MLANTHHIISSLLEEQERERGDIAHELHNNIAQILVSVLLYHGLSRPALTNPSSFFEESEMLINDAIDATRNLSTSLFTPHFGEESLTQALVNLSVTGSPTLTIHKNMNGFNEFYITQTVKLNLYRIVQAHLGYVSRRPGVRNINLEIRGDHEGIALRIIDDSIVSPEDANGNIEVLASIMARVTLLKGETNFTATPGKGTEFEVRLSMA